MRQILLLLVVPFAFFSALSAQVVQEITFVKISAGFRGNGDVPAQYVITNQTDWDRMFYYTNTEIDFSEYQVIAVFDQLRPNGCYSIKIIKVTEYANHIDVTAKNEYNITGTCIQAFQQPSHIVIIPVSDKPITFNGIPPTALPELTGLTETDNSVKLLYPNPVGELLTIPCNGEFTDVEIYDLKGNCLFSGLLSDKDACQLNVSFLNAGIYMVNISGKTYKMIKN